MSKKDSKYCITSHCKNKKRKHSNYCCTCSNKIYRKKNPMMYSFDTLRTNAKRRKKPFSLTFEQFKEFCYETDYMAGKGRKKLSYTIDCIIEEQGYVYGNIQKLSNHDNVLKEHDRRRKVKLLIYDYRTQTATVISNANNQQLIQDQSPF